MFVENANWLTEKVGVAVMVSSLSDVSYKNGEALFFQGQPAEDAQL